MEKIKIKFASCKYCHDGDENGPVATIRRRTQLVARVPTTICLPIISIVVIAGLRQHVVTMRRP